MHRHSFFRLLFAALLLSVSAVVTAQPQPTSPVGTPNIRDETVLDRRTQRVEHIRTEDAGSRVDELRSGGETKSITVQPKANVPEYDVKPADPTRPASPEAGPGSAGQRTWKVLKF